MVRTAIRMAGMCSAAFLAGLALNALAEPPGQVGAAPGAGEKQAKAIDQEALLRMLSGDDPREVRQAADQIRQAPPMGQDNLVAVAEAVKSALGKTKDTAAECALRLALGRLAAEIGKLAAELGIDAAEGGFESMSVTHTSKTPPEVFDSHVRALEMVPGAAKELMIGNLDVALNFPDADPKERQRLKEFVTLTAEGMRTRELSIFLDELLTSDDDLFVKIEAPLEVRLIRCYQKAKADPPINADAVVRWLDKHPGGPADVEIAALETVSLVGTTKADAAAKLAEGLLAKPESAIAIARRLIAGHIHRSLLPQVKDAVKRHAAADTKSELPKVLAELEKLQP
jgi:hypothetical protein